MLASLWVFLQRLITKLLWGEHNRDKLQCSLQTAVPILPATHCCCTIGSTSVPPADLLPSWEGGSAHTDCSASPVEAPDLKSTLQYALSVMLVLSSVSYFCLFWACLSSEDLEKKIPKVSLFPRCHCWRIGLLLLRKSVEWQPISFQLTWSFLFCYKMFPLSCFVLTFPCLNQYFQLERQHILPTKTQGC